MNLYHIYCKISVFSDLSLNKFKVNLSISDVWMHLFGVMHNFNLHMRCGYKITGWNFFPLPCKLGNSELCVVLACTLPSIHGYNFKVVQQIVWQQPLLEVDHVLVLRRNHVKC